METHFQKKPFETRSRKKIPYAAILQNLQEFFSKKLIYFSQKTQISKVLIILTFPVAFYSKFATIWRKNNFTFRREQNADVDVNATGKHQVKRTSEIAHLRGRFCFPVLSMAQNKNLIGTMFFFQRNLSWPSSGPEFRVVWL